MEHIGIMNNGKSSRSESRFLAIPQSLRRVVAICLLVLASTGVSAGDYVIFNGTVYLDGSTDGAYYSSLPGTSTFNPKTCIWTGTSGGTFQNGKGFYLYKNSNGYVQISATNSTNCTISGNTMRISTSSYQYLYRTSGYWDLSSKSSSALNCVYSVVTDNTHINGSSVNPTISGDKTFTTKGESYTFSKTLASYIPGYIDYIFYNNTHHYFKTDNETALTAAPTESEEFDYTWSLSPNANGYVSVNSSTGVVTYNKIYHTDTEVTLTLTATSRESGKVLTATKQITFKASTVSPTAVSVTSTTPMTVYVGQTGNISYSLTPATCYDNVLFETGDASIATVNANGIVSGVSAGSTTITVKAMKYNSTEYVSAAVTVNVFNKVATPVITFNDDGEFTISCSTTGATIYYTTNGNEPTTTDATIGNGVQSSTTVAVETVVKAIAVLVGYVQSDVASNQFLKSGISGNSVILNDYEDHNWTYYQGQDNLPNGYPADFLNSPDPRNVKITYLGGGVDGASAVAISGLDGEGQNTMIYYKTLEKHDLSVKDDGEYAYTVISNPFSKRPRTTGSSGTNGYYGFAGWKIISGGEYILEYSDGQTLPLDKTIHFVNLDNGYTPNCTSAEVVFEATWTTATVQTGTSVQSFSGGTYETNFWVINGNSSGGTVNSPCTVTMMTPDGGATSNYRGSATLSGVIIPGIDNVKVEFVRMNTTSAVSAAGYNYTLGRGIISTASNTNTGGMLSGSNTNKACDNVVKVESGVYSQIFNFRSNIDANKKCNQLMVLGCDYDRAKNDNTKLVVQQHIIAGNNVYLNRTPQDIYIRYVVKSGNLWANQTVKGDDEYTGGINQNFYISCGGYHQAGRRVLLMEGGRVSGIAGGQNDIESENSTDRAVDMRIRGTAQIDGNVYGAAEYAGARGIRTMIFTGGNINGWIAGGANGTQETGGLLTGSTYVYVGGNTTVKSDASYPNQVMNRAVGGNVFGAGCGYGTTSTSGKVTVGTNVVVSDDAYIERGVYGGGSYGFCADDKTSSLFILGGTVAGKAGGVSGTSYDNSIQGGVYGGACQNIGGSVNIYMDGGIVSTGIYGGSNKTGTLSGSVTMQINGGQVGTSSASANIHGGGYGASTGVSQNVEVTIGTRNTTTGETFGSAVVYGDVYGGSALGKVNGTTASDTYHTYVTLNAGTINGSLYGGALGNSSTAANVYGPVAVKVYGGSVKKTDENGANGSGAVYGANNINGAPQRAVTVDIYGTDPAPAAGGYALFSVYGGGNAADYSHTYAQTNGYPKVTVHNCDNSIEYVYGGGNAAAVAATDVTIYGGNKIGNVFGGGNGQVTAANVTGNTSVKIYGGAIGDVYGGSNTNGTIGGTITVNVNSQAESTSGTACPMAIDNVYGGGNKAASKAGTVTIGCTGTYVAASEGVTESGYIRNVYGGANQADITGNIGLDIKAGHIDNVFGGNNNSGTINGTITVTVKEDKTTYNCGEGNDMLIGNVYGGGNLATYGTTSTNKYPDVKILNGTISGSVFGGGKGDASDETHEKGAVTGAPQVTIGDNVSTHTVTIKGDVYGGGDAAKVDGIPVVVVNDCNTKIGVAEGTPAVKSSGTVYGGGNAAPVTGTNVTVNGGQIYDVFGGGHGYPSEEIGADVNGNVTVSIKGGTIERVFAGSNALGNISGTSSLSINKDGSCDMKINEVYGGGNLATGNAGTITIGCTGTGDDEGIGDVYGGANMADIGTSANPSNITLNVTGGTINRVFGGNNTSGKIYGSITVNVNKGTSCDLDLNYVYGAGNQAAYTPQTPDAYPAVNILNGTVKKDVFGGGLGSTATVTSNPTVTINGGTVSGNVFGGGSEANTVGNPSVTVTTGTVGKDVYGGGALANVTGNTTVSLTGGTVTGNTYGGGLGRLADAENSITAVAAMVTGNTTVTVNGGKSNNVFGCNNLNGGPQGNVAVTITTGTITNNVYGGGNLAAATADPTVTVNGGTMKNVYGGGLGESAVITGDPIVNISKTATDMTVVDVFGGGDAAEVTGNTTVNLTAGSVTRAFGGGNLAAITGTTVVNLTGATAANVYGGGNEAGVSSTATVAMSAGSVTGGLYGGCNSEGKVDGVITVGVTGGTIGTSTTPANVHGGGYGSSTETGGNVAVTINGATIYGDVYGGSALGSVNDASTETTTVTLTSGTINGDLYGGGLGDNTCAAGVAGKTVVAINGGTVNNVFGCNNANGAPAGGAAVTVNGGTINNNVYGGGNLAAASVSPVVAINNGTLPGSVFGGGKGDPTDNTHAVAMVTGNPQVVIGDDNSEHSVTIKGNVFGGGDAANVKGATTVTVNKCNTLIGAKTAGVWSTTAGTVYGGGNAADVVKNGSEGGSTSVVVNGGDIYRVFGGGNGEGASNPGANVANGTSVAIHAGNIHQAFAGSNAKGNITGTSAVTIDHDITACNELIDEVYGGGNLAAGNAGEITVECGAIIGDLYGGANQADIGTSTNPSNITLNVTGGTINRVFGGNNTSGNIHGSITVNVEKADDCDLDLNYVYGAGNQAAYAPTTAGAYPAVNILKGTVKKDVFGGGLGSTAVVTSNPTVKINGGSVTGNVFGGGSAANVKGNTAVTLTTGTASNLYGGGEAASVLANGTSYLGNTSVSVVGGTVSNSIYGGGLGNTTTVAGNVAVSVSGGAITKDVYGGSGFGTVNTNGDNSTTVTISGGTVSGDIYGGGFGQVASGSDPAYAADVKGDVAVLINGGSMRNVFGCNNLNGSPKDDVIVTITDGTIENVFGGGNQAVTTVSPVVNIQGGNISKVFGGGNEAGVTATDVNIDGGTITSGIYGGCNTSGTVTGDIAVDVTAGTIGNATTPTNIHGGGYGALTATTGNVNVTINGSDLDIYGDIYGGSALGSVNDNATDQTNVTLTDGNIHGSIYGGGLGQKTGVNGATSDIAANVNGAVQVTVNGGSVIGKTSAIYGCNNLNGSPQSTVNVDIYGTDTPAANSYAIPAVYGGGNNADYTHGSPHVTIHNCDNSIKFVYGGGNAADITNGNTYVTVWGANSIDTLFGGGNGEQEGTEANISGHSEVYIYGGTIHNVFGGSNTRGSMGDPARVTIESQIEPDKTEACPMDVTSLVPGGNRAYGNGGVLNIGCGTVLQDVYGGANNADIGTPESPKDIILNITGGKIARVFGGNNIGGTVYGKIVVNINIDEECGDKIGYVYGGGNQANYTAPISDETHYAGKGYTGNYPEVNIISGHILHEVYGGGLGDETGTKGIVTGNPHVRIYSGKESNGTTDKVIIDENVFGGGHAGKVVGNTSVRIGVDPSSEWPDTLTTP